MTENCRVNDCHKREFVDVLRAILEANKDFRDGMPQSWDGDPLQDACAAGQGLLDRVEGRSP